MAFSLKAELAQSDVENFLPQNLSPKLLAYIGFIVNEFIDQILSTAESDQNHMIRFNPELLDIVTKIYISQHGDHEVDTSDINNIILFQKNLHQGAINYCLAVFRESIGRDSGIDYQKPTLQNILTKEPEAYDCKELYKYIKQNKCSKCSNTTLGEL